MVTSLNSSERPLQNDDGDNGKVSKNIKKGANYFDTIVFSSKAKNHFFCGGDEYLVGKMKEKVPKMLIFGTFYFIYPQGIWLVSMSEI